MADAQKPFRVWRRVGASITFKPMPDLQPAEEILLRLQEKNPRFHGKAYLFLLSALHHVMEELDRPRHITGQELASGVRELAIDRYGPMARTVLEHWGIHATQDLGDIVFALVDCGILIKQDDGSSKRAIQFQNLINFGISLDF